MTSSKRWMCDGVPKNGKSYPGLGEAHGLYENDSPYCDDCGLPRESSFPSSNSKHSLPIKTVILLAVAGIIALLGGTAVYYSVKNRCDQGREKIEGQCIDPFRQPYEEATQKGDEAIRIANNYQTVEDLEQAEPLLDNALAQLSEIPTEALIYPEVAPKLEEYDQKRQEISYNLGIEKAAQQKLQEVSTIAQVAKGQTEIADTIAQLTAARQKWQEAQNKLKEVDNTRLITNQIQQHQSDYDNQIALIDEEISRIEAENNRIEQEKQRARNLQRKTPITPQRKTPITPRRVEPPRTKIYNPPNNVVIPSSKKPGSQKYYPTKPKTIPYDPCAVKNRPPNCLF